MTKTGLLGQTQAAQTKTGPQNRSSQSHIRSPPGDDRCQYKRILFWVRIKNTSVYEQLPSTLNGRDWTVCWSYDWTFVWHPFAIDVFHHDIATSKLALAFLLLVRFICQVDLHEILVFVFEISLMCVSMRLTKRYLWQQQESKALNCRGRLNDVPNS